ncbi:hypothetical protein ACOMHN_035772 [Nucella lapillus]
MHNVKSSLTSENLGNSADVEHKWALKAFEHADVYFKLICSVDPGLLRLTRVDEDIYTTFRATFPDMKVDIVCEDDMKSVKSKEVWRDYIEDFKDRVQDYNLGTLLRISSQEGYTEENTTLCVRIQFLAIEIARNKEKHNGRIRYTHGKLKDSESSTS